MGQGTVERANAVEANPRVAEVVESLVGVIGRDLVEHQVSYEEYRAGIGYLMEVAQSGELALLLDVFLDAVVEDATHHSDQASPSGIEGPYYVPDAPMLEAPYVLPMRDDEPGETLIFSGQVTSSSGEPLAGTEIDLWHATADTPGEYSMISPALPPFLLRGRMLADGDGRFEVRTVMPAPYEIPNRGPTGRLLDLMARHAWRPAHIHAKISAPGHRTLTTQLYFAGGEYLDADSANAVKPELIRAAREEVLDGQTRRVLNCDFCLQAAN